MAEVKSNIAQYIFNISGKELLVVKFSVNERISSPYEIDLTLISEDQIDFNEVLGKEALLVILGEEENRYFHGIILEFIQTGSRGRYIIYQTRVVPSLWLLSLAQGCRIFQNKNVQDIVKQVLTESGIISDRFSFRLTSTYIQGNIVYNTVKRILISYPAFLKKKVFFISSSILKINTSWCLATAV